MTIEAILPGNIGVIIDCESDSRLRTLMQLKSVVKKHGGSASPSSYLFEKRGRVVLAPKAGLSLEQVLEVAIEAGATDVEEEAAQGDGEDGGDVVVVYTEPAAAREVGDQIGSALGVDISSSEIVWTPNEDLLVPVADDEVAAALSRFVDDLHENDSSVQGIFMNISQGTVSDEPWASLGAKLGS